MVQSQNEAYKNTAKMIEYSRSDQRMGQSHNHPPPEYATGYITLKCIATDYLITLFCPHKLTYAIYLTIRVAALDQYINECLNIIKNMT